MYYIRVSLAYLALAVVTFTTVQYVFSPTPVHSQELDQAVPTLRESSISYTNFSGSIFMCPNGLIPIRAVLAHSDVNQVHTLQWKILIQDEVEPYLGVWAGSKPPFNTTLGSNNYTLTQDVIVPAGRYWVSAYVIEGNHTISCTPFLAVVP